MLIAQVSDTHVTPETALPGGAPTALDQLRQAVTHLLALRARPDVVLVTGDCTHHGSEEEVARFAEALAPLPMPVHVIPGNHDRRETLAARFPAPGRVLPGFLQYVVEDHPVRLVGLDTLVPGSDAGELCPERLAWLDAILAEQPARPTLVFMHHPPFLTGLRVLDDLALAGRERFAAILARHPQVERVVAGHVHCALQQRVGGTLAMTCTSTALRIAVEPGDPGRLWVSGEPAAALLHAWDAARGMLSWASAVPAPEPGRLLHDGSDWVR